jgi:hypothetical protein
MPFEVKELVIKTSLEPPVQMQTASGKPVGPAQLMASESSDLDLDHIIEVVLDHVLEHLKYRMER